MGISADSTDKRLWTYEGVAYSHIVLSGLCLLAACWHWLYWDLELFRDPQSGVMVIDLYPVFTDLVRRAIEELVE